MEIYEYLKDKEYPGRGILVGYFNDKPLIAYFIMGRSENSRNRIFVKDNDIIYTKAYDDSKLTDPSLIIYNALRNTKDTFIVTNGNQTDTIYDYLNKDKSIIDALNTRQYEPDEPNYTPRISAIIKEKTTIISILKHLCGSCMRSYYEYELNNNEGYFISTYMDNGNPLPSFKGAPIKVEINDDIEEFANKLWTSLNDDNKVSLVVRYDNEDIIFNKNQGE